MKTPPAYLSWVSLWIFESNKCRGNCNHCHMAIRQHQPSVLPVQSTPWVSGPGPQATRKKLQAGPTGWSGLYYIIGKPTTFSISPVFTLRFQPHITMEFSKSWEWHGKLIAFRVECCFPHQSGPTVSEFGAWRMELKIISRLSTVNAKGVISNLPESEWIILPVPVFNQGCLEVGKNKGFSWWNTRQIPLLVGTVGKKLCCT